MKKLVLVAIAVLMALMCSVEKEGKQETEKKSEGLPSKIVVGLDDTFAPMGFKNEKGEIVGFDIDLAREVAKRLNM